MPSISQIKEGIKKLNEKLDFHKKLKEEIEAGASGFDILYEIEKNSELNLEIRLYSYHLKGIGNNPINQVEINGKYFLKKLDDKIIFFERELGYEEYKLNKLREIASKES